MRRFLTPSLALAALAALTLAAAQPRQLTIEERVAELESAVATLDTRFSLESSRQPNIGGESAIYLTKQLQDFRSGARQHEQMSIIASGLSDEDIADLVAYYASIEFTVKVPE